MSQKVPIQNVLMNHNLRLKNTEEKIIQLENIINNQNNNDSNNDNNDNIDNDNNKRYDLLVIENKNNKKLLEESINKIVFLNKKVDIQTNLVNSLSQKLNNTIKNVKELIENDIFSSLNEKIHNELAKVKVELFEMNKNINNEEKNISINVSIPDNSYNIEDNIEDNNEDNIE